MSFNIPDEIGCEAEGDRVRFTADGTSTGWMGMDDLFVKRIDESSLNHELLIEHAKKEIQIKNTLDEAIALYESHKYPKAIEMLDEVLFYDPEYGEALLYKSYCLRSQRHFVKALRYYKRSLRADESLRDADYHKALLSEANDERSDFPKLKLNIYAGDEHYSKGEFQSAIESYDRALLNPSKFKRNILSKLLNKKASAYLKLDDYDSALECFKESFGIDGNDCALFGEGLCEHRLGLEVNPEFCRCIRISKPQMLEQALILRDIGYPDESSRILGYLSRNHFQKDDFYEKLIGAMD